MTPRPLARALLCLTATTATAAHAAPPRLDVQTLRPSPLPGALLDLPTGELAGHLRPSLGLLASWGDSPLVLRNPRDDSRDELVEGQLTLDLLAGLVLWDRLGVGLAMPFVLYNPGDGEGFAELPAPPSPALGDLRLAASVHALRRAPGEDGPGLGLALGLGLPTGTADAYTSDGLTFEATLTFDWRLGPVLIASTAGARVRPESRVPLGPSVDDAFVYRVGATYTLAPALELFALLHGAFEDLDTVATQQVELLGGARLHVDSVTFTVGVGGGLGSAYGNPDWRLALGASWTLPEHVADADDDGVPDTADRCPSEREDRDGRNDHDGCPDPDDDFDSVPDTADRCPRQPEDLDGFEDGDGCPDPDNDRDAIPDATDRCPDDAEDVDGDRDEDGCPDRDEDGDGIAEGDGCPDAPEDRDGFEDADGCPDPDNDRDGVPDATDRCPTEPEVIDGRADEDGCPDAPVPDTDGDGLTDDRDDCPADAQNRCGVKVDPCEIKFDQAIFFAFGTARIEAKSHAILDAIAALVVSRPHISKIEIQGHTDSEGPDENNRQMSQLRAEAVQTYLVGKGVAAERLVPKGYGEERPLVPNTTPQGRAKNRRVQLLILEPAQTACPR